MLDELARARGLSVELLRQLGWRERPDGVAIPWPRSDGQVAWHVRHHLDGADNGSLRWSWEAYDRDTLLPYGADRLQSWLSGGHRTAIVAESEVDAVALWLCRLPAIATGGASGWQPRWWSTLQGFGRVVVWCEDGGSLTLLRSLVATRPADGPELAVAHNLTGPKDPGRLLAEDQFRGPARILQAVQAARPVRAVEDLLQAVVSHLQARPSGQGFAARCPFHHDRTPSLSVFRGQDGWAFRCHAGSCGLSGRLELLGAVLGLVEASPTPAASRQENRLVPRSASDLLATPGTDTLECLPFLGHEGVVVRGWSHLLAGPPKSGKTELLWACVREWDMAGIRVLWATEETEAVWAQRLRRDQVQPAHVRWLFAAGRSRDEILGAIRACVAEFDVVVVDTLRHLFRVDELDNAAIAEAIAALDDAVGRDRTRVYGHHTRKAAGDHGERTAGGYAFVGAVDRQLELSWDPHDEDRRILRGVSRILPVPDVLLGWKGGQLVVLGRPQEVELAQVRDRVLGVLTETWQTTRELLQVLGEPRPSDDQVRRALLALATEGLVDRDPPLARGEVQGRTCRWRLRGAFCPGGSEDATLLPPKGSSVGSKVAGPPGQGQTQLPHELPRGSSVGSKVAGDGTTSLPTTDSIGGSKVPQQEACPDPGVDLLEGADLLATLSEEDAPEEVGQPPDLGLLPPGPGADLGPVGEDRGTVPPTATPLVGGEVPQAPAPRTCIDCGAPLPPDNLVRCEPCVARAWQEVWGEPPPPKQQRGPALPDATRLALGRGEVLP